MPSKVKSQFYQTRWFKLLLLFIFFIPSYTQAPYDPINTADVIKYVLSKPILLNIDFLLPMAKLLLLLLIVMIVFINIKLSSTIFLGYYAFILIILSVFQNISFTKDYGFTWLIGNTIIMLISSAFCIYDVVKHKTKIEHKNLQFRRLWVIIPMLLAFLMPYTLDEQEIIRPSFGLFVLTNEAGVTYCMITPVALGVMILFSKKIYKPTFYIVSFIGLIFAIMNMLTWFILQSQNWWMGVLHLPLLMLSTYGLILCRENDI